MAEQMFQMTVEPIPNGKISSEKQNSVFSVDEKGEPQAAENNSFNDTSSEGTGRDGLQDKHEPRSVFTTYLCALRPWSFTASISPVALGSTLAYKSTGSFDPLIFLTTVVTALSVHAAGNLVNTYYDYMRGIDNKKSDDRTLVDKHLSPQDVASFGGLFYIFGCAGFLVLTFLSPAKMEHLALVYFCGLSSSFLYTGGLGLKYLALGDLVIVFSFGPLTVVFAYLTQAGQLALFPFLYAIPIALNTEAILHSNNARDMETDKLAGIVTLAILLGHFGSYALFCVLMFLPYIVFILLGLHMTPWMFLPVCSIFLAFKLEKQFRRKDLTHMPQQVAKLNLLIGCLFTIACLFSNSGSLPSLQKNIPSAYERS
ncbi:ubiA prenyltransferase domain-containing protein 1-like [Babylonia areolata]|uniref:ubiA prenyltransferase domain-containing protein 1-like n=1 Tax=Babylonia areolata TaxID=304850 RepID=UPI003FD567F4